jgi:GNAT superfamily N-acetyltransferase
MAEWDGAIAGFALYFFNYSTFLCRPGLYLEDLFVRPEFRGRGVGLNLLRSLEEVARDIGCGRFEWSVLDWNQSAIDFYREFGAQPREGWTLYRKPLSD